MASSLLNRAETKRHLIMIAHESTNTRLHKFERVSKSALDYLETQHLLNIKALVEAHKGSRGITIKP
jgi:hypothetical protein